MKTLHLLSLYYNIICCDKCIHQTKSLSHRYWMTVVQKQYFFIIKWKVELEDCNRFSAVFVLIQVN